MPEKTNHKSIFLIIIWILSAVYVFTFVDRGWIPHDDGSLAQMAERVLGGELPHRDFDEIYTGGLSFLYAVAFKILGLKLISIRIVFFLFFLLIILPSSFSLVFALMMMHFDDCNHARKPWLKKTRHYTNK